MIKNAIDMKAPARIIVFCEPAILDDKPEIRLSMADIDLSTDSVMFPIDLSTLDNVRSNVLSNVPNMFFSDSEIMDFVFFIPSMATFEISFDRAPMLCCVDCTRFDVVCLISDKPDNARFCV